jgi:hypothetical protein
MNSVGEFGPVEVATQNIFRVATHKKMSDREPNTVATDRVEIFGSQPSTGRDLLVDGPQRYASTFLKIL